MLVGLGMALGGMLFEAGQMDSFVAMQEIEAHTLHAV